MCIDDQKKDQMTARRISVLLNLTSTSVVSSRYSSRRRQLARRCRGWPLTSITNTIVPSTKEEEKGSIAASIDLSGYPRLLYSFLWQPMPPNILYD